MKIAAFEFDYHIVQLCNFCKLFEGSEHQITVFTTEENYNRIKDDPIVPSCRWIMKGPEKLSLFMETNLDLINSHDLIFFNTIVSGYRTLYKAKFTIPSILRIHNAHAYLKPFQHIYIPKNFFEFYKSVSYIIREMIPTLDFYYIKKLIQKIDFICLNDYYREEYVIQERLIAKEKIFPCVPFTTCYSMAKEINPDNKILRIAIPGVVDERKRDYLLVVEALKKALPLLQNPIQICLLGKPVGPYGKKIISLFKELESEKFKLVSFNEFVSQEKYETILQESDLILAPMIVENQFWIYKEIYGKSKSSGNISDMISFGRLTAFPTTFHNDELMEKVVDKYDSLESLSDILVEYTNNRIILVKKSQELRNFLVAYYSPQVILKKFEKNYADIIGINR